MKTKKIIKSLMKSESGNRTTALTALIGGLAVGATIGILFATKKGKEMRQKICDTLSSLFAHQNTAKPSEPVLQSGDHHAGKRPKSDIKSIIHSAHTEQSLS